MFVNTFIISNMSNSVNSTLPTSSSVPSAPPIARLPTRLPAPQETPRQEEFIKEREQMSNKINCNISPNSTSINRSSDFYLMELESYNKGDLIQPDTINPLDIFDSSDSIIKSTESLRESPSEISLNGFLATAITCSCPMQTRGLEISGISYSSSEQPVSPSIGSSSFSTTAIFISDTFRCFRTFR